MQSKLHSMNHVQRAAILLIFGMLIGILFAYLMRSTYINSIIIQNQAYEQLLEQQELNHIALLRFTVINNLRRFFIFWALCITVLGIPYMIFTLMYQGFRIGFLIASLVFSYGGKGIVLYVSFLFPQCLIYIPVCLICLVKGLELANQYSRSNKNRIPFRKSSLLQYVSIMLILLLATLVGAVLESYLGPNLIYKAIRMCQ